MHQITLNKQRWHAVVSAALLYTGLVPQNGQLNDRARVGQLGQFYDQTVMGKWSPNDRARVGQNSQLYERARIRPRQ